MTRTEGRSPGLLAAIVVAAGTLGGCASRPATDGSAPPIVTAPPDAGMTLTPAEQSRRYRDSYSRGLELVRQGQYGAALGEFERAVQLKPDAPEALFNLGACYEAVGDPLRAINIYRRVLAMQPNDPDCYANLGTSFIKMYCRERTPTWRRMAIDAWKKSLALNPEQPELRRHIDRVANME